MNSKNINNFSLQNFNIKIFMGLLCYLKLFSLKNSKNINPSFELYIHKFIKYRTPRFTRTEAMPYIIFIDNKELLSYYSSCYENSELSLYGYWIVHLYTNGNHMNSLKNFAGEALRDHTSLFSAKQCNSFYCGSGHHLYPDD